MTIYPPIYLQALPFIVVNDHWSYQNLTASRIQNSQAYISIEFPKYQLIKGWKMVCGSNMVMESGAITNPTRYYVLACYMLYSSMACNSLDSIFTRVESTGDVSF